MRAPTPRPGTRFVPGPAMPLPLPLFHPAACTCARAPRRYDPTPRPLRPPFSLRPSASGPRPPRQSPPSSFRSAHTRNRIGLPVPSFAPPQHICFRPRHSQHLLNPEPLPSAPPPQNGLTALHWAAKHGHLALIDKLLAKGADIEAKGNRVPHPSPSITLLSTPLSPPPPHPPAAWVSGRD